MDTMDRNEYIKHAENPVVLRENAWVNSDGISLAASLFIPPGSGPHPGLVLCHGMPVSSGVRSDMDHHSLSDSGYELDYADLAEWCAWEGFATVIFNFRGTGDSGGNFHHLGWTQDLDVIISWLREKPHVDLNRIFLIGSSLGAAVAIYVTAHRDDVAGLVSFASPSVMLARHQPVEAVEKLRKLGVIRDAWFPESLEEWANESEKISPAKWVGNVAPRPLLLLHGDADQVVPAENAHALFDLAGENKELLLLSGVGHRFRHEAIVMSKSLEWIKGEILFSR